MATSSITANFTISDSKAAQDFATAFIRNSRKAITPVVMPWRMITSEDAVCIVARKTWMAVWAVEAASHPDIGHIACRVGRIALCAVMLICGVESAAQVSATVHFTNPVLKENWPDPAFWRGTNGTFYSVATGLRTVFASSNLIDWVDMRRDPLTADAVVKLKAISRNWWAPCVKRLDGRWVLYVSHFNTDIDCSVSVLVSDSETGPFAFVRTIVDGKVLGIENTIDPFVVEAQGRVWMFFGSDQDGIHRVELSRNGLHFKPGAEIVHVAGLRKKVSGKSQWGDQGCWEGAYLHPHGGWWYLFCSGGRYDIGDYHLTVGRSKRIDGVFYDRAGNLMTKGLAKPILASETGDRFIGPGHNGEVFVSDDGREWMFFHAHDVTREKMSDRPTLLQELKWTADGWPYFDGGKPKFREERFEMAYFAQMRDNPPPKTSDYATQKDFVSD